jgi:hypothetical protein
MASFGIFKREKCPSLHVSKDYQEMMQTYKESTDKSAQKMPYNLSNKN